MALLPLRFSLICTLLLSLIFISASYAAEQAEQQSVAIMPLQIHSPKDISYLKSGIRNMLASRLAAEAGVKIINQSEVSPHVPKSGQVSDPAKLAELGNNLYNNVVFMLNRPIATSEISQLLVYKRVLRNRFCDTHYAHGCPEVSTEDIASKVIRLTAGCVPHCGEPTVCEITTCPITPCPNPSTTSTSTTSTSTTTQMHIPTIPAPNP